MLFFTVIAILVSSSPSYSQVVKLVNKGYKVQYDSAVLMPLSQYRDVRKKSIYADTLIIGLRQEVKELNIKIEYQEIRQEANNQSNTILISQNKELRKANTDIMERYKESVQKKWYKRPELYGIAGLVIGVLISR